MSPELPQIVSPEKLPSEFEVTEALKTVQVPSA